MERKISFNTWITIFFGGIWQFIGNIFSWKNKIPFWRVVWAVITLCILAFTSMVGYVFYDEVYGRKQRYAYWNERSNLGDHYYFVDKGRDKGRSYISEIKTGRKILTDLDWIARPQDGDSLIVFAKGGKRGFFNRYSGTVAIPAKYDAAWCFNDGVAGVCTGDSIFFIDHLGRPINTHKFARERNHSYTYHGNYFIFIDKGKHGLVDRNGDIAVNTIYDDIIPMARRMWNVKLGDRYGVIDAGARLILPCDYKDISIYQEGGIVVVMPDNTKQRLDYDGTVIDRFVYDNTYQLQYDSDQFNDEGNRMPAAANRLVYAVGDYRGLMTPEGQPVTLPQYSEIEAIASGLYSCKIAMTHEQITINDRGEKVNN